MKPNIPNQKRNYKALNARLGAYVAQVLSIYDNICNSVATVVETTDYKGNVEFSFDDYPELKSTINIILKGYVSQMSSLIYSGTSDEWKKSNVMQDLLVRKVLKAYDFEKGGDKYNRYFQTNGGALAAFQERVEKGMNLSAKLWKQSDELKKELEHSISAAIDKGQSAVVLSKRLSQYLTDFPTLKADYTEKFGHAVNCRDCQYASMRLARTEINMAYRTAEYERWQQLDFILGFEVKLSKSHPAPDICDDFQGQYPKDFKFVGWHPNCMCYVVPIVMSDEQYYGPDNARQRGMIVGTPKGFLDYLIKNDKKVRGWNSLPYYIKDNEKYMPFVMNDEKAKILISLDFNKIDPTKYNSSAMRGFDIVRLDRELEKEFDRHEIRIYRKGVSVFENGNTYLQYYGEQKNGEIFELKRSFIKNDKNDIQVYHDYIEMPKAVQGKGLGKSILSEFYREYKRIGVKYLSLKANIDIGGYAWARYGFSASIKDVEEILMQSKTAQVSSKEKALSVYRQWREKNPNEDYFPMNLIAREKYGKKLLMGTHWNGILDLTDKNVTNYFEKYIEFKN